MNSIPTDDDMERCAGCGSLECDSECEAYYELERQALEDERKGIYLPAYCGKIKQWFCTRCGVHLPDHSGAVCSQCELEINTLIV